MRIRVLLLLICLPFFFLQIYGQKMNYQTFENISLGPEASVINCFIQDPQGIIWIGSNKGLFSFDGYAAQPHYSFDNQTGIRIYCGLVFGNYLYLGTDNGMLKYNYKTDRYEQPEIKFPTDIRSISLRKGVLWIGSLNGLYTYDLKKKQLVNIRPEDTPGLPHQTIYSIIHSRDDLLYFGTYNGLCRYLPKSNTFEEIKLPVDTQKSNQFVNSLLEDSTRNCIWIGTEGCLYKYTPAQKKTEKINLFRDNSIKSLAMDQDNNLLLGSDNGLYVYMEQTSEIKHIVHDSRNTKSLSNNIQWSIFADKEKNIWLGTDYGISLARNNRSFQFVPISQITGIGDGNQFFSIFKDSRNNFWFGGTNGLICSPSLTAQADNAIWYRMGDKKYPLSHNRIREIYEDKDKNLWIATDGSINRYDYAKKQFVHYNIVDSTHTHNSNWAYHIFEDDRKQLWIATCLGGIFVVDKNKLLQSKLDYYIAEHNYFTQNGLSGNFINQILPDHDGNIWVLLYNNGINKIDSKTGHIDKIPVETQVGGENPNYIICDKDGFIWVGFRSGLIRMNPKNQASMFVKFDTYGDSEILSMAEENENIWISTTGGVWVLNKQNLQVQRLNIMNRFFTSLFIDKPANKIYLGGVDGFAISSPEILKEGTPDAPIILTALYINDKLFRPGTQYKGYSIRYLDEITLNHSQNNVTFEFSDLLFSQDEKNKFVYKLEDFDSGWNLLSANTNRISYTNLTYGDYRLVISKLDINGRPSEITRSLHIHITPPWYYSVWAKGMYVILFIGLILWVINYFRVKNRLKIENIKKEKSLELSNLKIDFFTNVSHEFKTPLSLIIAPVSKLLIDMKDPQEKKQLELVQKNAMKLNSLIHQVLDFNRDGNAHTNLIPSKIEFVEFARSLFSIYEEGFKEKNLRLTFSAPDCQKLYMQVDVLKIESALNNLISNACKYTKEGGAISLSLNYREKEEQLEIKISDTGIGIPQQDLPYVFERFFQSSITSKDKEGTGIGLYLVKTYVELHGGKITISSEEGNGTVVTVTLPLIADSQTEVAEDTAVAESQESRQGKPVVLIVEDNTGIANFIYQTLTPYYHCLVAHNGKIGLEMCLQQIPDLIIADIMMPVMDGLEMCKRIKKNVPASTIPIILLTAKDDKSTEFESIRLQVNAFISKPFDPGMLLSRINQLLKSKQQVETKIRIETITSPKGIEATSLDEQFLSNITRIIEEKISDSDLNVNALSEISKISSKQIYRKLKQLTGLTPVEYIKSIRLKKAAMLLNQNKFSVAEVMYMVGYSNHSYFSKCFQSEFGKTPRQFMEKFAK